MLQRVADFYNSPQGLDWRIGITLAVLTPFFLTFLITSWNSILFNRNSVATKRPPTLPYTVPWLGHIFSFGLDGKALLLRGVGKFGRSTPFKLQLPRLVQYHTSGAEHVNAFFKTKGVTGNFLTTRAMGTSFGMPRQAVDFYEADDGGHMPKPRPGCHVKPGDRVMFEIHKLVNTNLSGESLIGITSRYQKFLAQQLTDTSEINNEWTDVPDLYAFMQRHVMEAATVSMFGTYILSLNPTFVEDFWASNGDMGTLFMGVPRWLVPSAYRNRTKMLNNIKRWHKYAHEHFDCAKIGPEDVDWEPYFGSKFSRRRQTMFARWETLDETARASDDFGFLWAANANAIPGAAWFLIELLLDRSLEERVQSEFSSARIDPIDISHVPVFDVNKLCSGPLCQSIYAETLRLHVGVMIQRVALQDINFCGWSIKKGESITVSSSNEAIDETVWNIGSKSSPHPVEEFWADRFLVYPDDLTSGPLRRDSDSKVVLTPGTDEDRSEPKFSLDGLSNSWIPFSGGHRLCPGRHFAKQEMISAAAIVLAAFEIELKTEPGWKPRNDKFYFGFGTMPPKGKIPCRMRRRQKA